MKMMKKTLTELNSQTPTRILVVEDHPIVRHGLVELLGAQDGMEVCGEAESITEGIDQLDQTNPHLVIVDLELLDGDGLQLIRHIKANCVAVRILVLSSHDDQHHSKAALDAGAMGFVSKHEVVDHVLEGVVAVLAGTTYLSPKVNEKSLNWFG
jgi:DNA-binding NarL/FixJ family response regulator